MKPDFLFVLNSILLGAGLAMDAFSVSLVDGLNEPDMGTGKTLRIAGVFALFQGLMPMLGWALVHTVVRYFEKLEKIIPWISLILLVLIGGKMLADGIRAEKNGPKNTRIGKSAILVQGVATSIDALSVGFTIAAYDFFMVLLCVGIIALVTFAICASGVEIGKRIGTKLSGRASVLGGIILILIGIETFCASVLAW